MRSVVARIALCVFFYTLLNDSVAEDNSCGENVWWTFSGGLLIITGKGEMTNFSLETDVPWGEWAYEVEQVEIEEGVTSIGDYAFYWMDSLLAVKIASTVTRIGCFAFAECYCLEAILIPSNISSIGNDAFTGCMYLSSIDVENESRFFKSIDGVLFNYESTVLVQYPPGKMDTTYAVPDDVISIESNAFADCQADSLVLSNALTSIGNYAFLYCELTHITIPASVVSIGTAAFRGCSRLSSINVEDGNQHFSSVDGVLFSYNLTVLVSYPAGKNSTNYTIPDEVTSLEDSAFYACNNLEGIVFADGISSIGDYAFFGCHWISSLWIGVNVESIGAFSFSMCSSLRNVFIPKGVKSIGTEAFSSCLGLTSIDVEDGNEHFSSVDGVLFAGKNANSLVVYPYGLENKTYSVPDGVSSIENYAFCHNSKLETVIVADSVTSIGDFAFAWCGYLTDIVIPNNVSSLGANSFYECFSLKNIIIPDSVTVIGDQAFSGCSQLKKVKIGNKVKSIGRFAFSHNPITTITIPKSVKSIGHLAFELCYNLASIVVEEGNDHYKSVEGVLFSIDGTILIQYPLGKVAAAYSIPDGVKVIEDYSFYSCVSAIRTNHQSSLRVNGLKSLVIPDSVTTIETSAFSCMDLTRVTIGSGVKTIGADAFSYCKFLTDITIPDCVESIGDNAFFGCSMLTSVFYEGSHVMSSRAFKCCDALELVCVSSGYESSSFCGRDVNSTSDTCKSFQTMFNHCYKPKYMNGKLVDEMRDNASEWESKTNACVEYYCDNESGRQGRSKCSNNNTGDITRICVDDRCTVRNEAEDSDKWIVELEMEEVTVIEMNISEVVMIINELAGTAIDELVVGYETDDNGYVIRIVVYAKDEHNAHLVSEAIESIPKGAECPHGVLCRTKNVRVKGGKWFALSGGHHSLFNIVMMFLLFAVSIATKP